MTGHSSLKNKLLLNAKGSVARIERGILRVGKYISVIQLSSIGTRVLPTNNHKVEQRTSKVTPAAIAWFTPWVFVNCYKYVSFHLFWLWPRTSLNNWITSDSQSNLSNNTENNPYDNCGFFMGWLLHIHHNSNHGEQNRLSTGGCFESKLESKALIPKTGVYNLSF